MCRKSGAARSFVAIPDNRTFEEAAATWVAFDGPGVSKKHLVRNDARHVWQVTCLTGTVLPRRSGVEKHEVLIRSGVATAPTETTTRITPDCGYALDASVGLAAFCFCVR